MNLKVIGAGFGRTGTMSLFPGAHRGIPGDPPGGSGEAVARQRPRYREGHGGLAGPQMET